MADYFISYTKSDRAWAEWAAWELEENGYTVVLQAWDFLPGMNFVEAMHRAVRECEAVIAVLSPDYLNSGFALSEWAAAFRSGPSGEERKLICVRVRECEPPGLLAQIIYLDLIGLEETDAREALLQGLSKRRAKPDLPPNFPGEIAAPALRRIVSLPLPRNANFTGRTDIMERIANGFREPRGVQILCGLGGVGKTQTALEFAYSRHDQHDLIWWFDAQEPSSLTGQYVNLAGEAGLITPREKHNMDPATLLAKIHERLADGLFIFDNAESAEELRRYLPTRGHVLVTSRNPNWRSIGIPIALDVMTREEALAFLIRRSGCETREAGADLADFLGCLPLALEQAGAFMEESGYDFRGYLELCRPRLVGMMSRGSSAPGAVTTTNDIAMRNLEERDSPALALVHHLAFYAPDELPGEILVRGAEHLPEKLRVIMTHPVLAAEAVAEARKYSLILKSETGLRMHRLTQAVLRERIGNDSNAHIAGALGVLREVYPGESQELEHHDQCAGLTEHVLRVCDQAEKNELEPWATAVLLDRVGKYLRARGEYPRALEIHRRAAELGIRERGRGDIDVATFMSHLAAVLRVMGRLDEALDLRLEIMEYMEKNSEHPHMQIHLNNLAAIQQEVGDLNGARENLELSIRLGEEAFGPDSPEIAPRLNNLGVVMRKLGYPDEARKLVERALRIDEKKFGPEHPRIAIRLYTLSAILAAQDDLEAALDYCGRSALLEEKNRGADSPNLALRLMRLGVFRMLLGRFDDALRELGRARAIFEASLGAEHVYTRNARRFIVLARENLQPDTMELDLN